MGYCEHGSEHSGSTKGKEFHKQLNDYQFFQEGLSLVELAF
jgi:hypothetical protein